MPGRFVADRKTSGDRWHLSLRSCKGKRRQWADHHPLYSGECGLDREIVGNRRHHVLGGDGERREAPRQYGAERGRDETARQQRTAALSEYPLMDPCKDDRLDEHREDTEGEDEVLCVHRDPIIAALEQDAMPHEAQDERG